MAGTNPWYAIRLTSGATAIARERFYRYGPRGGAHAFSVPDIDGQMAIERSIPEGLAELFIPCGYEDKKHKRKAHTYSTKRVPLIPGYAFVRNVQDWRALDDNKFVAEIIERSGSYMKISEMDIYRARLAQYDCWLALNASRQGPRKILSRRFPEGTRHTANHKLLGVFTFDVLSVTGKGTIRALTEKLGKVEIKVDDLEEVA